MRTVLPQDQVFWYGNTGDITPLKNDIITEVLVIGGGMAGLIAAQQFVEKGYKTVLIEKNFCGSGASGKSSGFITPDSELSFSALCRLFGDEVGKKLWNLIGAGTTIIKNNIEQYGLDCDYQVQDTLVLANSARAFSVDIHKEYENRQKANYPSTLYTREQVQSVIGSDQYTGGISYGGTFGIQAYRYCLGMKKVLQQKGVSIYEETPAINIEEKKVTTPAAATINADHIIVCTDRFTPEIALFWDKIYHVQTFLMLSAPLSAAQVKQIFPQKPFMVWDTDLIYQYYRLTGDNRLMLGGSNLLYTYLNESHNNHQSAKRLMNYFHKKFPQVPVQFDYIWPGLIGISKDVFPLAGFDQKMSSVYYIAGACGLPFAAALALYCADRISNNNTEFDAYFSPYRSMMLGSTFQSIFGTKLTFALSNFLSVGSL